MCERTRQKERERVGVGVGVDVGVRVDVGVGVGVGVYIPTCVYVCVRLSIVRCESWHPPTNSAAAPVCAYVFAYVFDSEKKKSIILCVYLGLTSFCQLHFCEHRFVHDFFYECVPGPPF